MVRFCLSNGISALVPPAPRDVSSVELLLKYHQGIKAEINTRAKNFSTCLELGESLLQRQHQASEEVGPSMSLSPMLAGPAAPGSGEERMPPRN